MKRQRWCDRPDISPVLHNLFSDAGTVSQRVAPRPRSQTRHRGGGSCAGPSRNSAGGAYGIDFEDLEAWFAFQEARSFTIELNEIGECCSPGVLFATDAAAIYKAAGWSIPGQEALDRALKACEQPKQASRSEENDFALEPAGSGETSSEVEENTPVESNVVSDASVKAAELLKLMKQGKTPEMSQSAA